MSYSYYMHAYTHFYNIKWISWNIHMCFLMVCLMVLVICWFDSCLFVCMFVYACMYVYLSVCWWREIPPKSSIHVPEPAFGFYFFSFLSMSFASFCYYLQSSDSCDWMAVLPLGAQLEILRMDSPLSELENQIRTFVSMYLRMFAYPMYLRTLPLRQFG